VTPLLLRISEDEVRSGEVQSKQSSNQTRLFADHVDPVRVRVQVRVCVCGMYRYDEGEGEGEDPKRKIRLTSKVSWPRE